MSRLHNFDEYHILKESYDNFSNELDTLDEKLIDAVKNPIKYRKIKNNAKKLQKAMAAKAMADLEYEKKRGGLPAEKKDVLKAATDAKKSAQDDLISAINQRMDDIATTDGLKSLVSISKTKAKVAAAEIALKTATDSEAAALKQQIKKYKQKEAEEAQKLKQKEAEGKKKEEAPKEEPKKDTEEKEKKEEEEPKGESKVDKIEGEIKTVNDRIEDERKRKSGLEKELDKVKKDQEKSTDPDSYDDSIAKLKKDIEDSDEDIKELKKEEDKLKAKLKAINDKEEK